MIHISGEGEVGGTPEQAVMRSLKMTNGLSLFLFREEKWRQRATGPQITLDGNPNSTQRLVGCYRDCVLIMERCPSVKPLGKQNLLPAAHIPNYDVIKPLRVLSRLVAGPPLLCPNRERNYDIKRVN